MCRLVAPLLVLLAGCRTRPGEHVLPPPGHGGCSEPFVANLGATPTFRVAIGDFDHDGLADLTASGHDVSVAWGTGTGDFGHAASAIFLRQPTDCFSTIGDFNRDGAADLVVGRSGQEPLFLAGGPDRKMASTTALLQSLPWSALASGDLDGDGVSELLAVVAGGQGGVLAIRKGLGNGTFTLFQNPPVLSVPVREPIVVGDVTGDASLDVAFATDLGVQLVRNRGGGALVADVLLATPAAPAAIALVDLDRDGITDVAAVVTVRAGDNVFLFRGLGGGRFDAALARHAGIEPVAVAALDFDDDGHLDVAVANSGVDHTFSIFYGGAGFTFTDAVACAAVTFDALGGPTGMAAGDLNGDGQIDLAFSYLDGVTTVLNVTR